MRLTRTALGPANHASMHFFCTLALYYLVSSLRVGMLCMLAFRAKI